ncbi:hypothetical protein BZZ01_15500 [Nostocales cyanobacterium HT-58-2]|nr:hypothetical protein BZZ01_15500 [Nostocales cyanobacterium HT-58-2]
MSFSKDFSNNSQLNTDEIETNLFVTNSESPVDSSDFYKSIHLLVLSAETESALEIVSNNIVEFLKQNPEINIADLAYTLQTNRQALNYRRIVVCHNAEEAVCALTTRDPQRVFSSSTQATSYSTMAFMFPGLGEQYVNMALQLYQLEPDFRKHIIHCSEILKPHLGLDLRDVLYPQGAKAEPSSQTNNLTSGMAVGFNLRQMLGRTQVETDVYTAKLNQTDIAQPALFVIEYALAQMWMAWGIKPQILIGYSLGEYVTACLAGVLSLEDALTLVVRRSQLIQQLPAGAMLAVSLSESELEPMLTEDICLSAVNGPTLSVVAGSVEAIAKLEQQLINNGIACRQIQTSHAFHSPVMEAIMAPFIELVNSFDLKPPEIPYISNVTGKWITAAEATDPHYWGKHLCQTVRFADGIETLWQLSHPIFLEVGPGQTLGSIALQHPASTNVTQQLVFSSLPNSYNQQSEFAFVFNTLGRLWLTGVSVNWSKFYVDQHRSTLPLPTYLFEHQQKGVEIEKKELSLNTSDFKEQNSSQLGQQQRIRLNLQNNYLAPRDNVEQEIVEIWQQVFKLDQIGVYDNFFSLGGHSLIAIQIVSQIKKKFSKEIPLSAIFANSTVADLAKIIAENLSKESKTSNQENLESSSINSFQLEHELQVPNLLTYQLANGIEIIHQNKAETDHFYEDIFEHKVYAKNGITLYPGDYIFDVGANIGLFTLFADKECSDATIYAFEPSPPTFSILKANTSKCKGKIKLFNCGLSNVNKTTKFTFYPNSSGMSSFYPNEEEEKQNLRIIMLNQQKAGMVEMEQVLQYTEELLEERFKSKTFTCELKTVSEIIRENNVDRIDLLKIDVQKSELDVLLGINQNDWHKIRQIVIEVHNEANRLDQVSSLLNSKGYSVVTEQDSLYTATNIYNLYAVRVP